MGFGFKKRDVDLEYFRNKRIVSKINVIENGYTEEIRNMSGRSASYYVMRDVLDEAEYLKEEGEVMANLEPLIKKGRNKASKSITYQIRVTEPELKAVKELASYWNLTISEWVAYMIIYRRDLLFKEREKDRRKEDNIWRGAY